MAIENWNSPEGKPEKAQSRLLTVSRRGFIGAVLAGTAYGAYKVFLEKHGHDHSDEILERFRQEEDVVKQIRSAGSFGSYFNKLDIDERRSHFHSTKPVVPEVRSTGCIDEGEQMVLDNEGNDTFLLHIAGSGIYPAITGFDTATYNPDSNGYIQAVARLMANKKITLITSHVTCGAAAGAYQKVNNLTAEEMESVPQSAIDNFAKQWSQRLAVMLRREYIAMGRADLARQVEYKEETQLARPSVHVARFGFVDLMDDDNNGFDNRNPKDKIVLPQGFVTSDVDGLEKAVTDHDVSWKITKGKHGPGNLITPNNPYHTVVFAPENQVRDTRRRFTQWHNSLPRTEWQRNRVEVVTPRLS